MIVLDTTVLVYAVGTEHRFRDRCRSLITAIGQRRVHATTTVEVLQEFAQVRARRSSRDDAAELAEAFTDMLAPLLAVNEAVLASGLSTFAGTSGSERSTRFSRPPRSTSGRTSSSAPTPPSSTSGACATSSPTPGAWTTC